MIKKTVEFQDADLILRLYDLRREPVMRESRAWIGSKFWPRSIEDLLAVARHDHPMNAAFRQVSSFWEMAYGMARNGLVNPDYLAENGREGLFLFAKILPYLERFRAEYSPMAFRNTEWLVSNSAEGERSLKMMRTRVQKRIAEMEAGA